MSGCGYACSLLVRSKITVSGCGQVIRLVTDAGIFTDVSIVLVVWAWF